MKIKMRKNKALKNGLGLHKKNERKSLLSKKSALLNLNVSTNLTRPGNSVHMGIAI